MRPVELLQLVFTPQRRSATAEAFGAAPVGSLLEWFRRHLQPRLHRSDRTLGKWRRGYAENQFDPTIPSIFTATGLQAPDPLMHGQFAGSLWNHDPQPAICPGKQYWDPDFWSECFPKPTNPVKDLQILPDVRTDLSQQAVVGNSRSTLALIGK